MSGTETGRWVTADGWADFCAWELASRDSIDVKRSYIDVADDLAAGVMLSQIVFYFLPGQEHNLTADGWLARPRTAWWQECRLTVKQVDRALSLLRERHLVETKVAHDQDGLTVLHVRLSKEWFFAAYKALVGKGVDAGPTPEEPKLSRLPNGPHAPDLPNREKPNSQIGKTHSTTSTKEDLKRDDDERALARGIRSEPDANLVSLVRAHTVEEVERATAIVGTATQVRNARGLFVDALQNPSAYVDHATEAREHEDERRRAVVAGMKGREQAAARQQEQAVPMPASLRALLKAQIRLEEARQ